MNRVIRVPKALRDVFGGTQTPAEIVFVLVAAVGFGAAICVTGADVLATVPVWRAVLAVLLIVDVAAGCVANFTFGTDTHYAARPAGRWVFILIHWHLVAVGALLGLALVPLLLVTGYVLLAASAVNLLHGRRLQVTAGGFLVAAGILGIVLWMPLYSPPFIVATAALFVMKVVFAFAVTHHSEVGHSAAETLAGASRGR
ncbi:hypothetical protein [Agromyces laixinhei]|uniref:hypothetical protein n=1 Tax=Agromyces laixinhei TaxID=2585717 RepID=UPI001116B05E|nr:hypothetical protein [Agromyces laixinhei]